MSKEDWEKNNIMSLFPTLPKAESVLDVACGLSLKSKFIPASIRVGVDIYPEYFKHIEAKIPYIVIKHDVRKLLKIFMPKSFDVILAMDIIEHLTKKEALAMIADCEQIARKAVVLETPQGFVPQNMDILGHRGHKYQTHRSGWNKKELQALGYSVSVRPYKMTDTKRHTDLEVDSEIEMLDAIKLL